MDDVLQLKPSDHPQVANTLTALIETHRIFTGWSTRGSRTARGTP